MAPTIKVPLVDQKRSTTKVFLEVIGLRHGNHEKLWTVWFMLALIIGLIANFVVLVGCMSSPTQTLYLFCVSSQDLINATSKITDANITDLRINGLPNTWYWSLSGVCAVYPDDQPGVACTKSFPPKLTIHEMLSFGIGSSLDSSTPSNTTADIETIIAPWTKVLTSLEDDLPSPSRLPTFIKAAAALALLSTVFSFALLTAAVLSLTVLRTKIRRWMLYIPAFFDAGAFLGAGVLLIWAMNDGPRAIIQLSNIVDRVNPWSFIGPGFFVLFAGVVFKLISIGVFFCVVFIIFIMIAFAVLACMSETCNGERRNDVLYIEATPHPVYVDEGGKRDSAGSSGR